MNASIQTPALDFDAILQTAVDAGIAFDAILTPEERLLLESWRSRDERTVLPPLAFDATHREQAEHDFTALAVADALSALATKIRTVLELRREELYLQCLEAYYVAEELSRDPQHAELIPHVEAMRAAHERDYGYPIPPKRGH